MIKKRQVIKSRTFLFPVHLTLNGNSSEERTQHFKPSAFWGFFPSCKGIILRCTQILCNRSSRSNTAILSSLFYPTDTVCWYIHWSIRVYLPQLRWTSSCGSSESPVAAGNSRHDVLCLSHQDQHLVLHQGHQRRYANHRFLQHETWKCQWDRQDRHKWGEAARK